MKTPRQASPSRDTLPTLGLLLLTLLPLPHLRAQAISELDAARLNNVGAALLNQQLLDRAEQHFASALRTNPTLVSARLNDGIARLYLNQLPESEKALQQAAAEAPRNPRAWYALGLLYRVQSQPEKAIAAFHRVLQLDPANADSHYFLGSLALDTQDVQSAANEFRQALLADPLHASAQFGLARALQRLGQPDQARLALERFQHLTRDKLGFPLSHNYGEEGIYGKAEDVATTEPQVAPMIPLTFQPAWNVPANSSDPTTHTTSSVATAGACLIPLDKGAPGLIIININAADHAARVYASRGAATFASLPEQRTGLKASGKAVACAVADYDHDGLPDLALAMTDRVLLFHNLGGGRFADVTAAAGIHPGNRPTGIAFVDFDHDGDLDLFVTGDATPAAGPNTLWRNNGNGTFTDWTTQSGLRGTRPTSAITLSDLNNDRAVDLLVAGSAQAPTAYLNRREGPFSALPLYMESGLPPTTSITILDFDKDGWMDVALTHAGSPGISLWRNLQGKRFARVPLPIHDATAATSIVALDFDNDGWIDLAAAIQTAHGPELRLLRNMGSKGFADATTATSLNQIRLTSPARLLAADLDQDGATDLVVVENDGATLALRNTGGSRNHSLTIELKGLADNTSGIGTKVEAFANGLWQKWEVRGGEQIIAGLGPATRADIVRLLWPTGVPQDEIDVSANQPLQLSELDRRGSSCPTLFAWDGEKYTFIADVIGAGVVGHWVAPAERNIADPDEWIKVDGASLKQRNGRFSLRFGEPMEEVNFVDQVRLRAIDHPAGISVYPNEGFLSNPPFAAEKTILATAAHLPKAAWDNHGADALPQLRARDKIFLKDFHNLAYAGFADTHTLTLDLGEWTPTNPLRLLLEGFTEYFSASSMYAAWQAGIAPIAPFIEARSADGTWKKVVPDMGFPAGLARTIIVDLTGKLPAQTTQIRIVTNLQIYWDQVLIDNGPEQPSLLHETELPLARADLAFRGYPQQLDGKTPGDLTYNYAHMSPTGPFIPQRGAYTRYGEVTPLLQNIDDQFVIFGTGEDMDLEFAATPLPPLPPGWTRDYFFYAHGFVKDMDFYEASPFTVDSLPFHGMSNYPYPRREHFPNDPSHIAYQLNWNTRFEPGTPPRSYESHYPPNPQPDSQSGLQSTPASSQPAPQPPPHTATPGATSE